MHCLPLEKCGLGQKFPSTITVSRSFSSYLGFFGCLWRECWGRGPAGIPDCYLTRYVTLGLRDFLQKQRSPPAPKALVRRLLSGVRAIRGRWGWGPKRRGKHWGGVTYFWSFPSSGFLPWQVSLAVKARSQGLLERPAREEQPLDLKRLVDHSIPPLTNL